MDCDVKPKNDSKSSYSVYFILHILYTALEKLIPTFIKEFFRNQHVNNTFRPFDESDLPTSSNKRFNGTKWKWIDIADIETKNTTRRGEKFARLDKKLILPGGRELYYNDSAYAAAAVKICAHCPEKLQKFLPVRSEEYLQLFLMDSKEVDWLSSVKGEKIANRMKNALLASQWTHTIRKNVPNRVPYLRTFWLSPINRKEQGHVFLTDVKDVILIALQQQKGNEKIDDEAEELWSDYMLNNGLKQTLNMKELKEAFEWFDVDKSRITLVPDIAYASSVMNQMSLNTGCPTINVIGPGRAELIDQSQAVFKIFQEVVCDIDWSKNTPGVNDPTNSIYAFQSEILDVMRKITEKDLFVWAAGVEECVKLLKTKKHYLKCKKKLLLTPLIKLFDCDINDSISISFFLSECEKYGIPYQAPPDMNKKTLGNTYLHTWKARLLFLYEWNKMFFDFQNNLRSEYGDIEDLIKSGIYHRAPLINWESEKDFMKLIVGVDIKQQEHVKTIQLASAEFLNMPRNHEWLENTSWRDRTYIKRCRKWEVVELVLELNSSRTPEGFERVKRERAKLSEEVLDKQLLLNERMAISIMTKVVDHSATMTNTAGHIINDSEKSAEHPGPFQASNLPETPKNDGLVIDVFETHRRYLLSRQQQNEGNETETMRNGKEKMQQSSECVAETEKVTDFPKVTPTVSADPFEAQRKEMDEMKQMIKMLQEEVRANKQTVSKNIPLETHQSEVKDLQLKIDHLHEKFQRTSNMCNERTAELKSATQKLEKLQKQESSAEKTLKEIQEKEKGKPTREQLEKQLEKMKKDKATEEDKFQKKVEKMEQEKADQVRLLEELEDSNRVLTAQIESQRLNLESQINELTTGNSELQYFYLESQQRIRLLKDQLRKEIVESFNFRPSLEMRKTLGKLRTDQETLFSGKHSDIALRKVLKLTKMTEDPKVHDLAEYWKTDYNEKLSDFSNAIVENIRRIQADPLITQPELLPRLEFPVLNDYIDQETTKAQQAINEKIERECMCCMSAKDQEGGWWWCSGCLKKSHQICLDKSVDHSGLNICPHCRRAIE